MIVACVGLVLFRPFCLLCLSSSFNLVITILEVIPFLTSPALLHASDSCGSVLYPLLRYALRCLCPPVSDDLSIVCNRIYHTRAPVHARTHARTHAHGLDIQFAVEGPCLSISLGFWGRRRRPILFSDLGFCMTSCSCIYIYITSIEARLWRASLLWRVVDSVLAKAL